MHNLYSSPGFPGKFPDFADVKKTVHDEYIMLMRGGNTMPDFPKDDMIRQWFAEAKEQIPTWDTDQPYWKEIE